MAWGRGARQEPKFDGRDAGSRQSRADIRIEVDDRIAGGTPSRASKSQPKIRGSQKSRIEPTFDEDDEGPVRGPVKGQGLMARGSGSKHSSGRSERYDPDDDGDEYEARPRRSSGRRSGRGGGGGGQWQPPRRQSRSVFGMLVYWSLVLAVWAGIGGAGLVAYYAAQLPPIDQLAVPKRPPNIAILGDDGTLLANRGDTGGPAIHLNELPQYLPKAFIAIEDRRFYSHYGIDPLGIGRALLRNVIGRGGMQGGSTLTQQLAKNLFLTQERTLGRKMQEAILAVWLEHKYSKDQILELYLNRVYFGAGAYGVEAATQKYFGHSARQATLPEAAMLAGLMKAPTKLAPNRNLEGATERAAQVITAMAQEGHITETMAQLALSHSAKPAHDNGAGSINYAADYVMDLLDENVGAIDEDIVVTTTLSHHLQATAEQALTAELDAKGSRWNVSQGAVVTLGPNGEIKALVGGRNYADSQFNRVIAAHRQPGSSFKPFVYLTALERGLTPDTIREDAPITIKGWSPENASRDYQGPVTLTKALAMSLNTVAVRLGLEVGAKAIANTAHRLGITSDLQANASIALGTSEVTPLEMASAYVPFANGGIGVQPHIILRVRTADGKLLYQRKGSSNGRIIEPQYVAMMNAMLQETLLTGTARKAELPGWQAAGKTGTSQDYRDAWFIGFTSQYVTAVWLGNDDSSPTKKVSGANLPVEIWSRFMKEAHKNIPPQGLPSGVWRTPSPAFPPASVPMPVASVPNGLPESFSPLEPRGFERTVNSQALPAAPAGAPLPLSGASLQNSGVGQMPAGPPPRRRDPIADLLPPASIPSSAGSQPRAPSPRQSQQQPNFFEKLFGG